MNKLEVILIEVSKQHQVTNAAHFAFTELTLDFINDSNFHKLSRFSSLISVTNNFDHHIKTGTETHLFFIQTVMIKSCEMDSLLFFSDRIRETMIKRLIFRIILLMVIATGMMSYIASLNGIDIRQLVPKFELPHLPDFSLPAMPDIKLPGKGEQEALPATVSKVYKWRGDDGSWHFSETLPEGVSPARVIFLNSETNVIQGHPQPDKVTSDIASTNDQPATPPPTQSENLNPYSKKAIDKLLNDARGVQEIMDQRSRDLEQASQGL